MNTIVTTRTITEARLDAAQLEELTSGSRAAGTQVVLQAEGLGSPRQWTAQLPTAADRIVVEYGQAAQRYERTWTLAAQSGSTRYYALAHDTDGSYITR